MLRIVSTVWESKKNQYVHTHYIEKGDKVNIKALSITETEAKITFHYGVHRLTLQDDVFQSLFKEYVSVEDEQSYMNNRIKSNDFMMNL